MSLDECGKVKAEVALAGTYSVSNMLDFKSDLDSELLVTFAVINVQCVK